MRRGRSFIAKTRRGKIKKVVKEHYLRDDIWCGAQVCDDCKHESPALDCIDHYAIDDNANDVSMIPTYIVVDTNVILHQLDVISDASVFYNVIYLQCVLDEVKHRNHRVYDRARELIQATRTHMMFSNEHHRSTYITRDANESPNDRNDRAIRVATQWYTQHLLNRATVVLLTNDAENKRKAVELGLTCYTLDEFVRHTLAKKHPHLIEKLAATDTTATSSADRSSESYAEHLPPNIWKPKVASAALYEGTFKVNRNFWSEGYVNIRRGKQRVRVLITGIWDMNRAFDGDRVVVQLINTGDNDLKWTNEAVSESMDAPISIDMGVDTVGPSSSSATTAACTKNDKPRGKIVAIAQRNWKGYCGSLEETERQAGGVLFLPVNRCIPRIRIESRQIQTLMDKRIVVQVDSWPRKSMYPSGHYVKTLGVIGDRDTETVVLLMEHDVNDAPFSANVMRCLPDESYSISAAEIEGRLDLRNTHCIFSIDPPNCKDIDDALHIVHMDNGNYEVGVHIADVTHYMKPDTALDEEAKQRGTSVYLVERRIDMIPQRLSTNLCSLVANVDRLAFSVIWELTPNADIVNVAFHKSIIRSAGALAYSEAQAHIDNDSVDTQIGKCCQMLNGLAKALRAKRMNAGALELASMEIKFLLDNDNQKPLDVELYDLREANKLVEEFMLLANISVATHILQRFPSYALLRRHPAPQQDAFAHLVRAAGLRGFSVDPSSSKSLSDTLSKAVIPDTPIFNRLLRIMTTRCMMQAVYISSGDADSDDYFHYGLASPVYTHFTSPIRRYADVVVHRLLATSLGISPIPAALQDRDGVSKMCDIINHRHRMAQQASRASAALYTVVYFHEKNEVAKAMITDVRASGLSVVIPKYGIESRIKMNSNSDNDDDDAKNTCVYDENAMCLTTTTTGRSYTIFDEVTVRIYVKESKMRRRWLVVELVDDHDDHGDDDVSKRQKLQ